ncbi:hypothetical protein A0U40_18185 [[Bacillus] sp. KCTC 13219]|nr:hypothetical protein A0U40_18185 [[Bacillus] sp. KCTC 13219]
MHNLLLILLLVNLVAFIIYVTKILSAKRQQQDTTKFKKPALYSLIIIIISFVGFGLTVPENKDDKESSSDLAVQKIVDSIEKVESDNAEINNGLTVDAYVQRLSKVFKEMGPKTKLKVNSIDEIDGNSKITLSNDTYIIANVQNNIIKQLTLYVDPIANYDTNDDFNFSFLLLIGTADTTLNMGQRNLVLRELGLYNKELFKEKHNSQTIVGTITFTYEGNPKTEYVLNASW